MNRKPKNKRPSHLASKWNGPEATCVGKQQHDRATARMIARKMKTASLMTTYLCPFCGHWHVAEKRERKMP